MSDKRYGNSNPNQSYLITTLSYAENGEHHKMAVKIIDETKILQLCVLYANVNLI